MSVQPDEGLGCRIRRHVGSLIAWGVRQGRACPGRLAVRCSWGRSWSWSATLRSKMAMRAASRRSTASAARSSALSREARIVVQASSRLSPRPRSHVATPRGGGQTAPSWLMARWWTAVSLAASSWPPPRTGTGRARPTRASSASGGTEASRSSDLAPCPRPGGDGRSFSKSTRPAPWERGAWRTPVVDDAGPVPARLGARTRARLGGISWPEASARSSSLRPHCRRQHARQ